MHRSIQESSSLQYREIPSLCLETCRLSHLGILSDNFSELPKDSWQTQEWPLISAFIPEKAHILPSQGLLNLISLSLFFFFPVLQSHLKKQGPYSGREIQPQRATNLSIFSVQKTKGPDLHFYLALRNPKPETSCSFATSVSLPYSWSCSSGAEG